MTRKLETSPAFAMLAGNSVNTRHQSWGGWELCVIINFGEIGDHVARLASGEKLPLVRGVKNFEQGGNPTQQPHSTGNYYWHTDEPYHEVPSLATLLRAIELPLDGVDTIFCNTHLTSDQLDAEQRSELDNLLAHATKVENVYRHKWHKGDLCMSDNHCTMHRADANYDMGKHRRILHRTVVGGTSPIRDHPYCT